MMKIALFALIAGLLILGSFGYGNGDDNPDLSNTAPQKDLIKSAVESARLEDRNGYKYLPNTENPYSGWAKETYDNGQVKYLTQFKEGNVVLATSWHENGQKESEAIYKNGKLHGLRTSWYENGQKETELNFKDGKLTGLWIKWYDNGQKKSESNYKDGKTDGLMTWWYENGQKQSERNFKEGKPDGVHISYDKTGKETFRSSYFQGILNSVVKFR